MEQYGAPGHFYGGIVELIVLQKQDVQRFHFSADTCAGEHLKLWFDVKPHPLVCLSDGGGIGQMVTLVAHDGVHRFQV